MMATAEGSPAMQEQADAEEVMRLVSEWTFAIACMT
jgi:hypothetical protein